ncbi:MAG: sigma-54 dependent transcriptional regulator [Thermodesulfobacteriota bacterium]
MNPLGPTDKPRILIVDDEARIRESIAGILADEGFLALEATDGQECLSRLEESRPDLVLLDIWMPGLDGLAVLKTIKESDPTLPVIMISGHGTIETAVKATRMGAYDFIEKPPSYDKIVVAISNALRLARLEADNTIYRQREEHRPRLTGDSPAMIRLRAEIERVAPTDAWVLIRGEHGTGKELVAQAIHRQSRRRDRLMVEVNCAAIPEELIESELFGHERGAFTGATATKEGRFDQADGGSLFLDEIGDMSLKTQAKILRILQEQKFERVGGNRTRRVDVRVLAATNKNLEEEIAAGTFREDLFWRLNVVPIFVPPLRERASDLPVLAALFLDDCATKGLGKKTLTPAALEVLRAHSWPGNVRELRNLVERLAIMCPEPLIRDDLVQAFLRPAGQQGGAGATSPEPAPAWPLEFREARRQFERHFLRQRLLANGGNISQTADQIGLERSHLHKKLKALALAPEGD